MDEQEVNNTGSSWLWCLLGGFGLLATTAVIERDKIRKIMVNFENDAAFNTLHELAKPYFLLLLGEISKLGYEAIITSPYRSFAKQADKDFRKKYPGASLPGRSPHNYGFALDLNLRKGKNGGNLLTLKKNGKIPEFLLLQGLWVCVGVAILVIMPMPLATRCILILCQF